MFLTSKDEYVPEGYIGIYSIFSEPKYALPGYSQEEWCLGYKTLDEMRTKTYKDVRKRFDLSGAYNFDKFWNGNLDAINDIGLNRFVKLPCFSELATAMICFETQKELNNGRKRKYISFGIKRDIYARYYRSLSDALKTGELPKKVNLYDRKKRHTGELFNTPTAQINFDGNVVSLSKNELFLMFEQWCKIKRKKKKQALYEAMELLMKKDPVDGLDDVKLFERDIDIRNREVVLNLAKDEENTYMIKVPEQISKDMQAIISRYNQDPENCAKEKLTTSTYAAQAIAAYNKRIPLKYLDPIAYREYLEIKEAQRYNENITNNRGDSNAK